MAKAQPHKKITQPPHGWRHFVNGFWEKEPLHHRITGAKRFVTHQELFQSLVNAGEIFREKSAASIELRDKVRFFLERTRVASPAKYLPKATDESLEGYHARLKSMNGDANFTLVINNAQTHSPEIWKSMRRFLSGLCQIVGLPLSTDVVIYLSKSATTAFGAHKDPYGNFLFQLAGQKRFRLWKDEVFERRPEFIGSVECDEIREESLSFDVEAGDLLYMPSGWYHFAEAGNELSIHLSIVLNTDRAQTFRFVENVATAIAKERFGVKGSHPFVSVDLSMPNAMAGLPAPLDSAFEAFANLDQPLKRGVIEAWTKRASAYGCTAAPPLLSAIPLQEQDLIQADQDSLIICLAHTNEVYVASNGHGFATPAHPNLLKMINQLKKGQVCRVRDLLKRYCGTIRDNDFEFVMDREGTLLILNKLAQMRAIQRIDRNSK